MTNRSFANLDFKVSSVGLGTWVMGGWMWGGADDTESFAAIEAAIEGGITLIDTAPVYGFGRAEEVVGKVVSDLKVRDRVILATKCGLEWDDQNNIQRNSTRKRILKEIDESRRRLQSDVIDLYQVHWPDEMTPFSETMEAMMTCLDRGWVKAIGLSNFNVEQMQECLKVGPVHSLQPSYNLFDRHIESEILPFCREKKIEVLAYGSIARGLLSGKFNLTSTFKEGDVRNFDHKFKKENLSQYLRAIDQLKEIADQKKITLAQLAIAWTASKPGVTSALVGARRPEQATQNAQALSIALSEEEIQVIESIVEKETGELPKQTFAGPPQRKAAFS